MLIPIKYEVIGFLDTETMEIKVKEIKQMKLIDDTEEVEFILNKNYYKMGGIAVGARNSVGKSMPIDEDITLIFNGENYNPPYNSKIRTHKTIRGRVNGLTKLFEEHPELNEGKIKVKYDINKKTLYIDYIGE